MASYVYLIQNGDLFNIGFTSNLERTRIDLRPGELVAFLITEKPEPLIKNLRKTYVDNRLPGSDYYKFYYFVSLFCLLIHLHSMIVKYKSYTRL